VDSNRLVVTIQHPAHVHFFKHALEIFDDRGYDVSVFSREKSVTGRLLEAYDIDHEQLAGSVNSLRDLPLVQATYEYRICRRVRELEPAALLAIAEPAVAHASMMVDGRSILFTDTEYATVQNKISFPFADRICTPAAFRDDLGASHRTYHGFHELAYLHPDWFQPDPLVYNEIERQLRENAKTIVGSGGQSPAAEVTGDNPLVFIRLVSWNATHDIGHAGLQRLTQLVTVLEREGATVVLSAEGEVPTAVADREIDIAPERIHDVLAHADLYLGESATMASESAVLGTPALYISDLYAGVLEELEERYGLLVSLPEGSGLETVRQAAEQLLATDQETWDRRRKRLLAENVDTTQVIVEATERAVSEASVAGRPR